MTASATIRAASTGRRRLLAALGATAAATLLGACGFTLRKPASLAFDRVALVGFAPRSALGDELRRALEPSAQVVALPRDAEVVLEALSERRERSVVAQTASGQVREVQLRARLQFRLSTRGGRVLLPPADIELSRDMTYRESAALAKLQEEADLFRAMERDIVEQVLRRLEAVVAL